MQSRRKWLPGIVAVIFSVPGVSCAHMQAQVPTRADLDRRSRFPVVDDLIFRHKPDLTDYGMLHGEGITNFGQTARVVEKLDEEAYRREVRRVKARTRLAYIDIEVWPTCNAPDSVIEQSISKFSRVIDIVREEAPGLTLGIYSILPAPDYWAIISGDSSRLRAWDACNRRLSVLARKVDVILPSLYTFYDDEAGWEKYAKATIDAARQYGKPVYPFLWPRYHDSNSKLGGKPIPGRVWRRQLEFCRREADGVWLWNWNVQPEAWDEHAEWWVETRAFLEELRTRN